MSKLHDTTLIIGEGPTEFYYFQSLKDLFTKVVIKPDCPKHTNINELEAKIDEGVKSGFRHILCIIDMDTKDIPHEGARYAKLKKKYQGVIDKPKKGILCEVEFFETHLCTELFFLYYFRYTSRPYNDQDDLLRELNQSVEYHKTIDFFKKSKGLHTYFEKNGGKLDLAVANAEKSIDDRDSGDRDYTYSELCRLIKKLRDLNGSGRN